MELLNLYGYLSVLWRALTLAFQSLTVGGVIFCSYVVSPLSASDQSSSMDGLRALRTLMVTAAIGLMFAQALAIGTTAILLEQTLGLNLRQLVGATFFLAGSLVIAGAWGVAISNWKPPCRSVFLSSAFWGAILAGSLFTSHALDRVQERAVPAVATILHQAATAAWIGGLPYFLLVVSRSKSTSFIELAGRRFSRLAVTSVALLISAGLVLAICYIGSPPALYGTSYGVMTISKLVLLVGLLALGAANRGLLKRLRCDLQGTVLKLRGFSEAEIAIGFTVVLAAASLTSQPPAVDLGVNQASGWEILQRLTPHWPRLSSPGHDQISPSSRQTFKKLSAAHEVPVAFVPGEVITPNTVADIAWSEYNHHWAGLIVLAIGLSAIAHRSGRANWARHWPLLFLALGAFILLRADPEGWPLGPDGFLEGFSNAEVLQHRLAVILVSAFGLFEWRLRSGRCNEGRLGLVFPAVCAAGGAVLLTHSHALGNTKEEVLAEISHLMLAVLAVAAGWARWLEIRLPRNDRKVVSWIWPLCFALIGAVLLDYRES